MWKWWGLWEDWCGCPCSTITKSLGTHTASPSSQYFFFPLFSIGAAELHLRGSPMAAFCLILVWYFLCWMLSKWKKRRELQETMAEEKVWCEMMACSWQVIWRCENMSAVQVEEFDFMLHYSDKTPDSCARQKFRHEKLTVSARFPNMQCSCSRLKCTHQFHLLMLYLELLPLTKIDAKIGKQTAINMQLKINST